MFNKTTIAVLIIVIINLSLFSNQQEFFKAVKNGDLEKVKTFIHKDKNLVNIQDDLKEYPLFYAVKNNNTSLALLLINYGAKTDVKDKTGKTVLETAIKSDYNEIASLLMDNGADVNAKDITKNSLIFTIIEKENSFLLRKMIQFSADVNQLNFKKESPLYILLEKNRLDMAEILLKGKPDLNYQNLIGDTLLIWALKHFKTDIVKFLLNNGADVNMPSKLGKLPLNIIADNVFDKREADLFNSEVLNKLNQEDKKIILEAYQKFIPVKIKTADFQNMTAGLEDNDKKYLNSKYILNIPDEIDLNTYRILDKNLNKNPGSKNFLKVIYKENIDEENIENTKFIFKGMIKDEEKFSIMAVLNKYEYDKSENKKAVIENITREVLTESEYYKINETKENYLLTDIHHNENNNIWDIFKKANFNYDDRDYYKLKKQPKEKLNKVSSIIFNLFYNDISGILIFKAKDINFQDKNKNRTALHDAVDNENYKLIQLIITKNADLNIQDFRGQTPLHIAVINNKMQIVKSLVDNKADLSIKDKKGKTALHHAVNTNNFALIKYLIDNGADVSAADSEGYNSIILTVLNPSADLKIFELMTKNIANLNQITYDNKNLLHFAVKSGNIALTEYLIDKGIDINKKVDINIKKEISKTDYENRIQSLTTEEIKVFNECFNAEGSGFSLKIQVNDKTDKNILIVLDRLSLLNKDAGFTPLHFAASGSEMFYGNIATLLVKKGADIMKADLLNRLPLHTIANNPKGYNVIDEFIKIYQYSGVNSQDIYGKTPLHYACEKKHSIVLESLLGFKKSITKDDFEKILTKINDSGERTFIQKNYILNDKNIYELKANISYNDLKQTFAILNKIEYLPGNINIQDNNGWSCLHYAAANLSDSETITNLLICNSDIRLKDIYNNTALSLLKTMSAKNKYGNKVYKLDKNGLKEYLEKYNNFQL